MDYVVDTSAVIAVILNESHKERLVEITNGVSLHAPSSLHWETGNALSAMLKRDRLDLKQATKAISHYQKIPVRFHDVGLDSSLELAKQHDLYAYDAYFIDCSLKVNGRLLTLDRTLMEAAQRAGVEVIEV
jgi:predicted nucleic acid-binding protein